MRNLALKRHPIVAVLIALAVLATPALLFAHAHLVRSTPAANATITSAPTSLTLWFSEKPEPKFTAIVLTDSGGSVIRLGAVAAVASDGVTLPVVGTLAPGRYTVSWKTAASDGHATSGKYSFTLAGTAAASAAAAQATPAPAPAPAIDTTRAAGAPPDSVIRHTVSNAVVNPDESPGFSTAMRWAELVALLTLIGLVIFRLAVLPVAGWDAELVGNASDRVVRFGRAVMVLFAVATLSRGFAQANLLPGFQGSRFAALLALVQGTRWGVSWAIGVAGLVLVLIGFLLAGKLFAGWVVAALGLVTIAVSEALTGHSGSVRHAAAAISADVAHVLGAGGWLGGLTALLLCGMPAFRRLDPDKANDAASRLIRSYHGAATECVAVVVLSAIIAVWVRLPSVSSLWTTPYGLALLRKTIFVAVVLGFGFYHWRRIVIPPWTGDTLARFKRSAAAELVFGAVVVALTAYLITQPLP